MTGREQPNLVSDADSNFNDDELELIQKVAYNILVIRYFEMFTKPFSKSSGFHGFDESHNAVLSEKIFSNHPNIAEDLFMDVCKLNALQQAAKREGAIDRYAPRGSFNRVIKNKCQEKQCCWPGCDVTHSVENSNNIEADHRIPKSLGGASIEENAQPLCKWHNHIKTNNPLFAEWSIKPLNEF